MRTRREVLVLLGARQVGKTTILKKLFPQAFFLSVDTEPVRQSLNRFDPAVYRQFIKPETKILVIDEIHLLDDPGRTAKIIHDQIPRMQLIVTGSSSFRIKNKTSESLAGRKVEYLLYPLTLTEYLYQKDIRKEMDFPVLSELEHQKTIPLEKHYLFNLPEIVDNLLLYGLYPALVNRSNDDLYLKNLVDSVVFKDLLDLSLIENRPAALNLLKLLAYQIGSLVNFTELANRVGTDVKTIKRYFSLFEQSFIIFTLSPFSTRKRDEIGKMPKIYFYDVGLRNALISDFKPVSLRPDAGALWENFVIAEILKANYYGKFGYRLNFWRTKQGSEVDLVLQKEDGLFALEIKSSAGRVRHAFRNRYPQALPVIITKRNILQ